MQPLFLNIQAKLQARRAKWLESVSPEDLELLQPGMTVVEWLKLVSLDNPEKAVLIRRILNQQDVAEEREKESRWGENWGGDFEDPSAIYVSGIATAFQTFDAFKKRERFPDVAEAEETIRGWVRGDSTPMIILLGPPGTGKTHLCQAAGLELMRKGYAPFFRTEADLVGETHQRFNNHSSEDLIQFLCSTFWLIIDDLGAAALGEWDKGLMDRLINNRYKLAERNEGQTLISTNLEWKDMLPRIGSRLRDPRVSTAVNIRASDYRVVG